MRICLVPWVHGVGGMVSFQAKMAAGLAARNIQVSYDPDDPAISAILLTGGTRHLAGLLRARRRGVRIVQRLDGINWLHQRLPTGTRHFLRAEYGNRLLALLRARLVSRLVYQSAFVQDWWTRQFGRSASRRSSSITAWTSPPTPPKANTTSRRISFDCWWWKAACREAMRPGWQPRLTWPGGWPKNTRSN